MFVLWTLVLIAFLVAHLTATGRTEIRISGNLVSNGVAQAAADGANFEAIFYLSDPQPQQRLPVDGNTRELLVDNVRCWCGSRTRPGGSIRIRLRPRSWNHCCATSSDPETARCLANAIGEWVGSAPTPRPQNMLLAEYGAAGLDYDPLQLAFGFCRNIWSLTSSNHDLLFPGLSRSASRMRSGTPRVSPKNRDWLLDGAIAARFLAVVLSPGSVKKLLSSYYYCVDGTLIWT
jgi:hypothetical protein